ncbi:MAG: hypothetical protein R3300_02965, partial [Candidatus Promineifilaceae bacterium]|nr:hypothetical protein [Candidatus Promineifilaceae bacterium]
PPGGQQAHRHGQSEGEERPHHLTAADGRRVGQLPHIGFEEVVRFEHHITETWKSIVRQPYNRRDELTELADHVPNISAKHEGGDPEVEQTRDHPSDILDYFRDKEEIQESCDWEALATNFMDKFEAVNRTAWALTENGLSFIAARRLHHR